MACLCVATLSASAPAAVPPDEEIPAEDALDIYVRSEIEGYASWIIPTGTPGRYRWLAAKIVSDEDAERTGAERFYFVAIRGHCRARTGSFGCGGAGRVVPLEREHYDMDPSLSEARLRTSVDGLLYDIRWQAHQPSPGVYLRFEGCIDEDGNEEQGQGAGVMRDADARGRFGNRQVRSSNGDYEYTFLSKGVKVTGCESFFPGASLDGNRQLRFVWEPAR